MRPLWAVVRREYLTRVRSRWFVATTAGVPLILAAVTLVSTLVGSDPAGALGGRTLVLVDRTASLAEALAPRLEAAGYTVLDAPPARLERGALRSQVGDGSIDGYMVLDEATLGEGVATYVTGRPVSYLRRLALQQAVVQAVLSTRLGESGEASPLLAGGELRVEAVDVGDPGREEPAGRVGGSRYAAVYGGALLIYMATLGYAMAVLRSVLEEKSSRVVEIVISAMKPWPFLLGKILGVGAVGLTQMTAWVLLFLTTVLAATPAILAARPGLVETEAVRDALPGFGVVGLFFVFFLGGYFLFAGLYAAVGAMCTSEREAGQASLPLVLVVVAPVALLPAVLADPGNPWWVAASLVPFFSPTLMYARAAAQAAAAWEVGLSIVLMVSALLATAWVAGRIYRVGILMTGKRPTLTELLRWVREA